MALLLACLVGAWLLGWQARSSPTIISGQVINWGTGKPAEFAEVRSEYSGGAAKTDAQGRFTFVAPHGPDYYFLFAGSPHYGRLLQTFFGQTVVAYRGGEEIRNVVIPAIPATSLSGHVYDSDGRPLAGCDVTAVTKDSGNSERSVDFQTSGIRSSIYRVPQHDAPNEFIETETETTDSRGAFGFTWLGADRYFLLARCRETANREAGAFEDAFALHDSRIGPHSKLEALLAQQGQVVEVRAGETITPATRVMTTSEIISLALDSLRTQQR